MKQKFGLLEVWAVASDPALADAVHERVTVAEQQSGTTCERCGAPGLLHQRANGWMRVECDVHAQPAHRWPACPWPGWALLYARLIEDLVDIDEDLIVEGVEVRDGELHVAVRGDGVDRHHAALARISDAEDASLRREVEAGPAAGHLPPIAALGYTDRADFDSDVARLCDQLSRDKPGLSTLGWSRIQFLAEISWASDMFGAGVEFEMVSLFRDSEALALLRSVQRALVRTVEVRSYFRVRTRTDQGDGGWSSTCWPRAVIRRGSIPRSAVLFTAVGVALLVVGVRRRSARSRWDRDDDRRLLDPGLPSPSDEPRSPRPRAGGGWLSAVGAVLLVLGLLHVLDLIATVHESAMG